LFMQAMVRAMSSAQFPRCCLPVTYVSAVKRSSAIHTTTYGIAECPCPACGSSGCSAPLDGPGPLSPKCSSSDQVQQRVQEDPDQVDEVPVETAQLEAGV